MNSNPTNVSKFLTDFISSLGVCTHFNVASWYDGPYRRPDQAVAAIEYLGISNVRVDSISLVTSKPWLVKLANSDIKFTFMNNVGSEKSPLANLQRMAEFERDNLGAINAIEGPNEIWNWPVEYKALRGDAAAQAWQNEIFNFVKGNKYLKEKDVFDYTDIDSVGLANYSNFHMYSTNGDQPSLILKWNNAHFYQNIWAAGRPKVLTETGMPIASPLNTTPIWEPVNELTQARLSLNSYAAAFSYGYTETYLFELVKTEFSCVNDPTLSAESKRDFGLFNQDWTPRIAAKAIANFTDTLFSLKVDNYMVSNFIFENKTNSLNIKTQALSFDGDSLVILLWRENDIWDEVHDTAINHPTQNLQVSVIDRSFKVNYYDPINGINSTSSPFGNVALGDNLLILNVDIGNIIYSKLQIKVQIGFVSNNADQFKSDNNLIYSAHEPEYQPRSGSLPVIDLYRFFEKKTGTHFYTSSTEERDEVRSTLVNYNYEGVSFYSKSAHSDADEVYRFFKPDTGTHFFTISLAERDNLISSNPNFRYEGVGFFASDEPSIGLTEVYRFFKPSNGAHFYTASPNEKEYVQNLNKCYTYEGIGFYVPISHDYQLIG